MPRIERIEPSRHVRDRYLLFLDTGTMIKVGPNELLSFSLRPGDEIGGETLDRLLASAELTQTKARAARMIGSRPLSKADLVDRLVSKGEGESQASAAADWLEGLGALNDGEYAKTIVRYYDRRGYGPQKIREELYRRKIPRPLWEEALEELRPGAEAAADFLESRFRSREVTEKELQKQLNALRRRGFGWDAIREAAAPWQARCPRDENWD